MSEKKKMYHSFLNILGNVPIFQSLEAFQAFKAKGYRIHVILPNSGLDLYEDVSEWLISHGFPHDELSIVHTHVDMKTHFKKECLAPATCILVDNMLQNHFFDKNLYCNITAQFPMLRIEVFDIYHNGWRQISMRYVREKLSINATAWQVNVRMPSIPAFGKEFAAFFLTKLGTVPSCTHENPELFFSITHNMAPRKYRGQTLSNYMVVNNLDFKLRKFYSLREYQRVSYIPGLPENTGSKKNFCTLTAKMENRNLPCFLIPEQIEEMKDIMHAHPSKKWILKVSNSLGSGSGITIHNNWTDMQLQKQAVVQEYVLEPFLFNGRKLDLRLYPIITSTYPLRIYWNTGNSGGYARIASSTYRHDFNDKAAHITNLQGTPQQYVTMKEFYGYIEAQGFNLISFKKQIKELLTETIEKLTRTIKLPCKLTGNYCRNFYQVLGFDVVLDRNANPYVIEVNPDPGYATYHDSNLWCHHAERLKQVLSLLGLIPNEDRYGRLYPQVLSHTCNSNSVQISEYFLHMMTEYIDRNGADLIYPQQNMLEQFGKNGIEYTTYKQFFEYKHLVDNVN